MFLLEMQGGSVTDNKRALRRSFILINKYIVGETAMYVYKCIINRIVDGDTVDVDIDLGFNSWLKDQRIRIVDIDAPETRTRDLEEKRYGKAAAARAEELLPVGSENILHSKEFHGKYGRIIGDFEVNDTMFSKTMLNEGHAVLYKG